MGVQHSLKNETMYYLKKNFSSVRLCECTDLKYQ